MVNEDINLGNFDDSPFKITIECDGSDSEDDSEPTSEILNTITKPDESISCETDPYIPGSVQIQKPTCFKDHSTSMSKYQCGVFPQNKKLFWKIKTKMSGNFRFLSYLVDQENFTVIQNYAYSKKSYNFNLKIVWEKNISSNLSETFSTTLPAKFSSNTQLSFGYGSFVGFIPKEKKADCFSISTDQTILNKYNNNDCTFSVIATDNLNKITKDYIYEKSSVIIPDENSNDYYKLLKIDVSSNSFIMLASTYYYNCIILKSNGDIIEKLPSSYVYSTSQTIINKLKEYSLTDNDISDMQNMYKNYFNNNNDRGIWDDLSKGRMYTCSNIRPNLDTYVTKNVNKIIICKKITKKELISTYKDYTYSPPYKDLTQQDFTIVGKNLNIYYRYFKDLVSWGKSNSSSGNNSLDQFYQEEDCPPNSTMPCFN